MESYLPLQFLRNILKITLANNESVTIVNPVNICTPHITENSVLLVLDDQWVRVDIIDNEMVTTLCGYKDGKPFDKQSLKFEKGQIVPSSEPT